MIFGLFLLKLIFTFVGILVGMWLIGRFILFSNKIQALQVKNKKMLSEFKIAFSKIRTNVSATNDFFSTFKQKLAEKLFELFIGSVGLFFIFARKRKK